jgi:hypothetical protein
VQVMNNQARNRFPSPQRGRGVRGEGESTERSFLGSRSPRSDTEPWKLIQSTGGPLTPSPSPALGRGEPRAWCFLQLPVFVLVSFLSIFLASPPSISAVVADWQARAKEALSHGDLDDARRTAELGKRRDLKEAESSFVKELSLDPNLAQGHFELGKLYFQQAAYDRAEKSLERRSNSTPDCWALTISTAWFACEMGIPTEARRS